MSRLFRNWTEKGYKYSLARCSGVVAAIDEAIENIGLDNNQEGFEIAKSFALDMNENRLSGILYDVICEILYAIEQVGLVIAGFVLSLFCDFVQWGVWEEEKAFWGLLAAVIIIPISIHLFFSSVYDKRNKKHIERLKNMSYEQYLFVKRLDKKEYPAER